MSHRLPVTSGDVNRQAPMLGSQAETPEARRKEHMCVQTHTHTRVRGCHSR